MLPTERRRRKNSLWCEFHNTNISVADNNLRHDLAHRDHVTSVYWLKQNLSIISSEAGLTFFWFWFKNNKPNKNKPRWYLIYCITLDNNFGPFVQFISYYSSNCNHFSWKLFFEWYFLTSFICSLDQWQNVWLILKACVQVGKEKLNICVYMLHSYVKRKQKAYVSACWIPKAMERTGNLLSSYYPTAARSFNW